MGIVKKGESGIRSIRAYYDGLKKDAWSGTARDPGRAPYYGPTGLRKHLTQATKLGGLYVLGQFRGRESRLFTAAKYAVAPIINTTILGKAAKIATDALRTGQQLGVIGSELTNSYPDIAITKNPLKRIKSVFNVERGGGAAYEIRKRYGLQYDNQETSFHTKLGVPLGDETFGSFGGKFFGGRWEDMIPVRFKTDDATIPVRGIVGAISDTVTPTWNETSYVGRPQGVVSYGGFTREVTFDLTIAAINPHQLRPMWRKINDLSNLVLPQSDGGETRFAGRLCEVTVGSYLKDELCAVSSFTITPNEDSYWELGVPEVDHPSLTLNPSVGNKLRERMDRKKELARTQVMNPITNQRILPLNRFMRKGKRGDYEDFKMPRVVTISIGLKVLHNSVPGASQPLFDVPLGPDTLARRRNAAYLVYKNAGITTPRMYHYKRVARNL